MKSKLISFLLISMVAIACSPKKITGSPAGDGKSYETSVIIQETTESAGVNAEYQWIKNHYTDYKVVRQSLMNHEKKSFDVITIEFRDGRKQDIYFDISNFFK